MSDIIKKDDNQLVSLFHTTNSIEISKPFERDILLFETHIAGTGYVPGFDAIEPLLQLDDKVDFFREIDNKVDKYAVVIQDVSGNKLGYLPAKDNLVVARLMDAGKLIFGKIINKKKKGTWNYIEIGVYLKD